MDLAGPIFSTLAYHDLFDYPLTKEEIYRWLISDRHINRDSLFRALATFLTSEVLPSTSEVGSLPTPEVDGDTFGVTRASYYSFPTSKVGDLYFLSGRGEIVEKRKRRAAISAVKIKKAKRISWLARLVPWIKLVGLTGALAMENCEEGDDIDWLIITSPHRLWLSRACLVSLLLIFGEYRRPNKIKDKICPNVWLTLDNLKFPPDQRSLFLAHEMAQMRSLWDRQNTYDQLLRENGWVEKFLVNFYQDKKLNIKNKKHPPASQARALRAGREKSKNLGRLPVISWLFDHLDDLAGKWQRKIMAKKVTTETIGEGLLKFHPQDVSAKILVAYNERLKRTVL